MAGQIINKITAGGGTHLISPSTYFTCNTAAGTAAKMAKLVDTNVTDKVTIEAGTVIWIKFTNSNSAANPTLTLQNSSGTNLILQDSSGTTISQPISLLRRDTSPIGPDAYTSWWESSIIAFVFDGNNWLKLNENVIDSVGQTHSTSNGNYPVLFSSTTATATKTSAILMSSKINFNPSTGNLTVTQLNGYTPSAAMAKGVSNSITTTSSATLPTVSAVAAYVAASCPEEVVISSTTPTSTATKIWVRV